MLVSFPSFMIRGARVNEVAMLREMDAPFRGFEKRGVGKQERKGEETPDHSAPMRLDRRLGCQTSERAVGDLLHRSE